MAQILDGRAIAATLRVELATAITEFTTLHGRAPGLVAVAVGKDEAAASYFRAIGRSCKNTGVYFQLLQLDETTDQQTFEEHISQLNIDPTIDGIILQMPLPRTLNTEQAIAALDPRKDVDGLHPINLGRLAQGLPTFVPNTPAGGMELLRRYDIPLVGRKAVIVGRSNVVGKPLALLMLQQHATVTICHTRTSDLAEVVRQGDIVAAAAGRAGLITAAMIKPGAVILDFGINVDASGKVYGDVDFADVEPIAGAITPVPGGTGPMTNMMLIRNTLEAARALACTPAEAS